MDVGAPDWVKVSFDGKHPEEVDFWNLELDEIKEQKAEDERLAAEADEAAHKAETERLAKETAETVAALKAEKDRLGYEYDLMQLLERSP